MLANVATFSIAKRDCPLEECEDASWVGPDGTEFGEFEGKSLRVVISDGASESLLARRWAKRLSATFGTANSPTRTARGFLAAYRAAVNEWSDELVEYMADRESRGVPIQWYEEPGLEKGAHATLLAVEFIEATDATPPSWRAVAVGDSCLFQVRNEQLHASFPMQDADDFSYQPPLLSSRGGDDSVIRRHVKSCAGDWDHEDTFYVVTDALAAWFLRSAGAGGRPWEPLRDLNTSDFEIDFETWVNEQRDQGDMHDDDTTLVRVDVY